VFAPMSEAADLSSTRFFCEHCKQPTMVRVFSMTVVGVEKFRGIDGQSVKETYDHWTGEARKAGLDPAPVDSGSWT